MIDIKDIQGNIVRSVPITQSCKKIEELMVSDYIQLSWNSDSNEELQAGCYIEHDGEKFSLLEPYKPTQKNEVEFTYTPQFNSKVMAWSKVPFFFYTTNESKTTKEPDWTLTSNPADFMKCVCDALKNETGEDWTYSIDASLPASASLSFNTTDIFSSLNEIARAFETEWYADKVNNILYLGKASFGEPVILEVGENIKVPTVNSAKEGYYTRFFAFGSTRNITQNYEGSNVNNLVNKRLTLDPVKYPNGYKDIRADLKGGVIFSKVLVFEDVYPSSNLSISSVRTRLMYRVDGSGNKIQIGTDENGTPIYDQYAIWYFRIDGFEFDPKNIIQGKNLSVHFQTGALAEREFELKYYESKQTITTSDGLKFDVQKGDYEILFVEEGNHIIPSLVGLVPSEGDEVVLFNIEMPSEYTQSAYDKLEAELDKEIERLTSNLNNYSFNSNPVAFNENNPNLTIGRNVTYKNGDETLNTRVIKLTTQLDFPIEQNITIGNEKIKGNTQQLKEEVATANKDLNLLSVFNDMTSSLQQSYARTQQMMLDGFAAIKNMWQLREDDNGNRYIYSAFNVATEGGVTMYRNLGFSNIPSIYDGLPIDNNTIYWEDVDGSKVLKAKGGGGVAESVSWSNITDKPSWLLDNKISYSEIADTPDLGIYVTETELTNKGYLTQHQDLSGYQKLITSSNKLAYSLISGTPTALKNPTALKFGTKTYDGSVEQTILASDLGALTSHQTIYTLTFQSGTFASGSFTANSGNKTINIPTTTSHVSEGSNLYFTNARAVSALADTLKSYVTLSGTQTISGEKNFTGGLKVNGSPIVYDASKKYWKLEGDLLVTGGVTMYGNDSSFTPSTIMDAIAVDGTTISKEGRVLRVIGGGSGIISEITKQMVIDALGFTPISSSDVPTALPNPHSLKFGSKMYDGSASKTILASDLGITWDDILGRPTLLSSFTDDVVAGKYLPLSGGTISECLTIGGTLYATNNMYLNGWFSSKNHYFFVRDNADADWIVTNENWTKEYSLIHTGNYSSYALPLTGGTISGNVVWKAGTGHNSILPGHIYRNLHGSTGDIYDHYYPIPVPSANTFANLRVLSNDGSAIKVLRFGGDGTFTWDGKTIIHSGNIGSQSVNYATSAGSCTGNAASATYATSAGNANTLDSKDSTDFFRILDTNYDLNSIGDYSKKNGVIYINASYSGTSNAPFGYGSVLSVNVEESSWMLGCQSNGVLMYRHRWWSANGTNWSDWKTIAFTDSNVASASNINNISPILVSANEKDEIKGIVCPSVNTTTGLNGIYANIHNGLDFRWHNSHWLIANNRSSDASSNGFGFWFSDSGNIYTMKAMISNNGIIYSSGGFSGELYGNALSATKLQTARTIWGQSFDGTGDVNGTLTIRGGENTGINFHNTYDTYNFIRFFGASGENYAVIHAFDSYASYKNLLNIYASGGISLGAHYNPAMLITSSGNVGIGTTNPLDKLHVAGNLRLKNEDSFYGNCIYFGDDRYCYIGETTDDSMTIYASKGIQLNGKVNIASDTTIDGNLLVRGGITMYKTDGNVTPFLIDVQDWELIDSMSVTQVYTAHVTTLLKEKVKEFGEDVTELSESLDSKIRTIKTALQNITSSSSVSAIGTALNTLYNSL